MQVHPSTTNHNQYTAMTTTNSNGVTTTLGINLPDPFIGISQKQINIWLDSHVGIYDDEGISGIGNTVTHSFLQSLFFEGCMEAREFGLPEDGSRYFWTVAGRLVRIYSKSLIRALRRRIKEADEALEKLRRQPEFKKSLAILCDIPRRHGFDALCLLDAEFAFRDKKGQHELHLLYGISDYVFALPSWVEDYIFLRRDENTITR